jgi:phosphopantothenoylcysteine synthetase/decarboxylase
MGAALARAALKKDGKVIFVTGPAQYIPKISAKVIKVISALDMLDAVKKHFEEADIIISAAAVSDFRPENFLRSKIKKTSAIDCIKLKENPDIAAFCGKNKKNRIVAGFALETDNLFANAFQKIKKKKLDFIVANGKESLGADKTTAHFLFPDGKTQTFKKSTKTILAGKIIDETIRLFKNIKVDKKSS